MVDKMTVQGGVGPKLGGRIYRNLKKGDKDIIHYEYKGLLFREVLEQDVSLIREVEEAQRKAIKL